MSMKNSGLPFLARIVGSTSPRVSTKLRALVEDTTTSASDSRSAASASATAVPP